MKQFIFCRGALASLLLALCLNVAAVESGIEPGIESGIGSGIESGGLVLDHQDALAPPPQNLHEDLIAEPGLPQAGAARLASEMRSLEALNRALASKEEQAREVQQRLIAAQDSVTQQELTDQLRKLRDDLADQRRQFERFAVNIDLRPFIEEEEKPFNWQDELSKLLKPIIAELENATRESRAIGELRAQMNEVIERKTLSAEAREHLETLLAQQPSPTLRARLEDRLTDWQRIHSDARNRYAALELQLNNRLEQRQSVLEETTGYARRFFRTRGLNLTLAIGAFAAVFFGFRWLSGAVRRAWPAAADKQFSNRLAALVLHILSVLVGLIAMMLVFNLAGDWFMLGIILIFLIGIGWASIKTLPSQIEIVRLILNIGPVREGERILFQGLPYRVESLAFTARLVNPLLDGGVQQMPVRHLVGRLSRPAGEQEPWFPTQAGDWVELADGRLGCVQRQNPSSVCLREPGGAELCYPTEQFLAQTPRNLSRGFRVTTRFGIDSRYQPIASTEVLAQMRQALERELANTLAGESLPGLDQPAIAAAIKAINVLFVTGGPAALEF